VIDRINTVDFYPPPMMVRAKALMMAHHVIDDAESQP
jgi:hypothetical protein